jgi:hypothetical protein
MERTGIPPVDTITPYPELIPFFSLYLFGMVLSWRYTGVSTNEH